MSESSNESREKPETGLIPDEDLPEDLQPEENPLARNPDEEGDDDDESAAPQAGGMGDMGDPGAPA